MENQSRTAYIAVRFDEEGVTTNTLCSIEDDRMAVRSVKTPYLDNGGLRCPACGGQVENEGGHTWEASNVLTIGAKCQECEATWYDVFILAGFLNLKTSPPLRGL